jgi:hypothetical protein
VRRLIVLDADHKLAGILALGDLALLVHDDSLAAATLSGVSTPGPKTKNGKQPKTEAPQDAPVL